MTTDLQALARSLDKDFGPELLGRPPALVRVLDDGEVGSRELDPEAHPFEQLLGFCAPDEWAILGIVAYGWGGIGTNGAPRRSDDEMRSRIRVIHLLDRHGAEAHFVRFGVECLEPEARPEGRVPDALRRALGLPTEPPPPPELGDPDVDWDELRWAVIQGRIEHPCIDGALAAWMDAGMFARITLSEVLGE